MAYFASLGTAFIIIELTLVQVQMKLVGFPVYAFTVVIFALLLAAALGSLSAELLEIGPDRRWWWPFAGLFAIGLGTWVIYPDVINLFLSAPTWVRIAVAVLLTLPLGFFMGMPFPLGILLLDSQTRGAIAWAWGMNGLFTVIGGVAAGVLSIEIGFRATILIALGIYGIAFFLLASLRSVPRGHTIAEPRG
jgi:hypothetical protein